MTSARIPPLSPPYSDEVGETFKRLMPPGMEPLLLFRTVAHNPRVLRRMQRGGLLDPGSITARQRELVILRTCFLCGAEYEWGVHATLFGASVGLNDEDVRATLQPAGETDWPHEERLIVEMCDALHERGHLDDALYASLAGCFSPEQVVELSMLAGLYHAVSFVVNTAVVQHEPWARTFASVRDE
ncbi:MAG: carboxymuconolactone decarboxylase family protein [Nannocystaceae bacterium]|nr:carboxymuconolactone decarboxylase family protein [Nannocystaceae bacterium]